MINPPRNEGLLSVTAEVAGSTPATPAVESAIYGKLSLELVECCFRRDAVSPPSGEGMPDKPIGVADRSKRIVWGVQIRAVDPAVIDGNDQRKIGGGKTLEGAPSGQKP
jgi:hypothetical protein